MGTESDGLRVDDEDVDWYRTFLDEGRFYRVTLEGSGTGAGTLEAPAVGIADENGDLLYFARDTPVGGTAKIDLAAPETGVHYVLASGPEGSGDGTYRLGLEEIDMPRRKKDLLGGDVTTVGRAASQRGIVGRIESKSDEDWYQITLHPGERTTFILAKERGLGPALSKLRLDLRDEEGRRVATGEPKGKRVELSFSEGDGRPSYIVVSGRGGKTGGYRLRVEGGDVPGGRGSWGRIRVGESLLSRIWQASESDWFRVRLEADEEVRIEMRGLDSGIGSLPDPSLRLLDATGSETLATDTDAGEGRDAQVDFRPATTGVYLIAASSGSTTSGSYELRVIDLERPRLCSEGL